MHFPGQVPGPPVPQRVVSCDRPRSNAASTTGRRPPAAATFFPSTIRDWAPGINAALGSLVYGSRGDRLRDVVTERSRKDQENVDVQTSWLRLRSNRRIRARSGAHIASRRKSGKWGCRIFLPAGRAYCPADAGSLKGAHGPSDRHVSRRKPGLSRRQWRLNERRGSGLADFRRLATFRLQLLSGGAQAPPRSGCCLINAIGERRRRLRRPHRLPGQKALPYIRGPERFLQRR